MDDYYKSLEYAFASSQSEPVSPIQSTKRSELLRDMNDSRDKYDYLQALAEDKTYLEVISEKYDTGNEDDVFIWQHHYRIDPVLGFSEKVTITLYQHTNLSVKYYLYIMKDVQGTKILKYYSADYIPPSLIGSVILNKIEDTHSNNKLRRQYIKKLPVEKKAEIMLPFRHIHTRPELNYCSWAILAEELGLTQLAEELYDKLIEYTCLKN